MTDLEHPLTPPGVGMRLSYILCADVIAKFAFEEEMGNLVLEHSSDGKVSLIPRPEIEVTMTLSMCFLMSLL